MNRSLIYVVARILATTMIAVLTMYAGTHVIRYALEHGRPGRNADELLPEAFGFAGGLGLIGCGIWVFCAGALGMTCRDRNAVCIMHGENPPTAAMGKTSDWYIQSRDDVTWYRRTAGGVWRVEPPHGQLRPPEEKSE